jgi:hypothetical protein
MILKLPADVGLVNLNFLYTFMQTHSVHLTVHLLHDFQVFWHDLKTLGVKP